MAKCVEKLNRQPLLEILNNINVIIIQARLSSLKSEPNHKAIGIAVIPKMHHFQMAVKICLVS